MAHANDFITQQNGTGQYYRHWLLGFKFTDGVKELADLCNSYWLIDLIVSHQTERRVYMEPFQVWHLKRLNQHRLVIVATDGNSNEIARQELSFSDFPYDSATIWMADRVLYLPSEH
ncbi:MAG: hypothetical protein IPH58_13245 [Sphingobacteriales bacterium]|jgi:hypothetical protein|nr:hypothetical protein [Sphingobacteriales bacterium]